MVAMKPSRISPLLMFGAVLLSTASPVQAATSDAARLFALEVKPLLAARCFACHGQDQNLLMGGLDLTSRDSILKGGKSGAAVLAPGDAEASLLYKAVTWSDAKIEMPPKANDRFSEDQTWKIRDWINGGAPWPDEKTQQEYVEADLRRERVSGGVLVETSGGLSDDWTNRRYKEEDLWAFRPLRDAKPPDSKSINPIDAFHQASLRQAGFETAARANNRTLLRRASYNLTGLPPTPSQADAFLSDDSPEAWAKLIDTLLESPRYGEQWGRHWLDVVRYADTAGNSNDYERSNAWRYRDYVIRSFNGDKPFNQFIVEQIAGDELNPEDPEMLVATGFLRMGPWGSAMVPKKMARQAYLDDVVNNVGQAFLSTPLRCAKCHDHKFDPIPTRDYYRIYATFATTQMAERPAEFLESENQSRFAEGRRHVSALKKFATEHKNSLEKKLEDGSRRWYEERGKPYLTPAERKDKPDEEKPPRHYGLDHVEEGRLKVRKQDEWIWNRRLERYQPLAQSVFNGPDYIPPNGRKLRVPEEMDPEWRPRSAIFGGGSVHAPTEPVRPGVLSAINASFQGTTISASLSGRRLEFARWVADARNPLSTRSIVNRVWQYHFGRGLAANPNNFGKTGGKPTHPELLDWLTADFVEHGWSIKHLHRMIMTSRAYQQAGDRPDLPALNERDPNNELLAYFEPRRLTAEELRDGMLAVSGELNPEMGGVPIMPEINLEVALQPRMIQFSIAPAHQPSRTPDERNRRSIYAYRVRGQADPFLEVFNQPNPNDSCERRDSAAVSPQALTLMNSDMATDRSIAFALRLEKEAKTATARLERAFALSYGRAPTDEEAAALLAYLHEMEDHHLRHTPSPKTYPTHVTRSLVEEFTGQPFEYEEWLPVFEDYVSDVKPWEVEPSTRALADLCLLLFNSNEFSYVY